jgi:hypothetical protein
MIDRATLAFWVGYAAAEVKPCGPPMREEVLRSTKLFVDETTAPVLDPGRGRTKKGYFWVLARGDRPWRGGTPPAGCTATRRGAAVITPRRCCRATLSCCKPTGMPLIAASPIRSAPADQPHSRSVGHIGAGSGSILPNRPRRHPTGSMGRFCAPRPPISVRQPSPKA